MTLITLSVALVTGLLCVLVHVESLRMIDGMVERFSGPRMTLLFTWAGLLSAHVLEIWLYGVVYWLCDIGGLGGLQIIDGQHGKLDYVYFSAVVYTTLGFGDIVPEPGVRLLAGSEALVGLCLIAWSATVTFAHVQDQRVR